MGSSGGDRDGPAPPVRGEGFLAAPVLPPRSPSAHLGPSGSCPAARCPVGRGGAATQVPRLQPVGIMFVYLFLPEFRSISYTAWKLSDPKEQKIREDWVSLPPTHPLWLGDGSSV